MNQSRHLRLWVAGLALALVLGCAAKKTAGPPMPPTQSTEPAATPETTPQPTPSPTSEQQSQLPNQGTPPPEPEQSPSATANNNKKPSPAKRATAKKTPTPATQAKNSHVVVHPDSDAPPSGGTISPQPAPAAPNEPTTEQLLQSTESSLNGLNRQLSAEEQAMVTQIRDYIAQSRNATKDNDVVRAHNFAVKAHLVCDDLLKRH